MRVDAQKNRQRLIDATVQLVLETGSDPARDTIAQRAGVGIGTLYRHFPNQQSLLHAVARCVLERSIEAGEALVRDQPDRVVALREYMHTALDNGIGVINIIHPLIEKPEWPDLQARAAILMTKLVGGAKRHARPGKGFSEGDIVFALTRFARPLAMGLPAAEERSLSHRHLDFYLDGLLVGGTTSQRLEK